MLRFFTLISCFLAAYQVASASQIIHIPSNLCLASTPRCGLQNQTVELMPCDDSAAQQWTIGVASLENDLGFCLTTSRYPQVGEPLMSETCRELDLGQFWYLDDEGVILHGRNHAVCLTPQRPFTAGSRVGVADCLFQQYQSWWVRD